MNKALFFIAKSVLYNFARFANVPNKFHLSLCSIRHITLDFCSLIKPQVKPKDPRATHFVPRRWPSYEDVIRFIKTNSRGLLIIVIFRGATAHSLVKWSYTDVNNWTDNEHSLFNSIFLNAAQKIYCCRFSFVTYYISY
jgi:hypothetical protein